MLVSVAQVVPDAEGPELQGTVPVYLGDVGHLVVDEGSIFLVALSDVDGAPGGNDSVEAESVEDGGSEFAGNLDAEVTRWRKT